MTVQGGKTGPVLLRFIEEELAPKLRPGDDVVLDNLRAHHVEGVRARIEATGARLLYQPLHCFTRRTSTPSSWPGPRSSRHSACAADVASRC